MTRGHTSRFDRIQNKNGFLMAASVGARQGTTLYCIHSEKKNVTMCVCVYMLVWLIICYGKCDKRGIIYN
jgi:hypothetical protein